MKKSGLFVFVLAGFLTALSQEIPVWDRERGEPATEFNRKVNKFLDTHPGGCIIRTTENPAASQPGFRENDEWLKPVNIGAETRLISFRPVGKRGKFHFLGDSLYHVRDYEGARQAYLKSIDLNPKNWFSYLYLGDTFFIFDRLDTAKYWFEAAVEVNPRSWKAWKYLGDLRFEAGDTSGAIDAAIRSILLNPYGFESWGLLSIAGQAYGFSAWSPADSVPVVPDLVTGCLLADEKQLARPDVQAMVRYLSLFPVKALTPGKLETAYTLFAETWETVRPDSSDFVFEKEPYREYLLTVSKTEKMNWHVFFSHTLMAFPEAGLLLNDEEFEEMVQFFKNHFIIYPGRGK